MHLFAIEVLNLLYQHQDGELAQEYRFVKDVCDAKEMYVSRLEVEEIYDEEEATADD